MMPDNELSVEPVYGPFLPPDDKPWKTWEDWELGGIAHQDTSQGLRYQPWKAWYDPETAQLLVQPQVTMTEPILVMTQPRASYIGLTFDRNMNLSVCWRIANVVYLYWFDTTRNQYVTEEFIGGRSPRVTHDDKRLRADSWDDVLLFYLVEDRVKMRVQRDRFLIEHDIGEVDSRMNLYRCGMTTQNRIQLEIR